VFPPKSPVQAAPEPRPEKSYAGQSTPIGINRAEWPGEEKSRTVQNLCEKRRQRLKFAGSIAYSRMGCPERGIVAHSRNKKERSYG